ncbi:MAG: DUF2062 domain-containing protein [Rhodospirillum sp.]|nr:DUF2062 domain-containing protein [Rhodospirillum sp.]MCF8490390.1 DUF2062 domain-containing protein [Rhodospirillum sp.]MCF8501437.1 DUF2062 domain-containing protein [Rhodospirillum sp.]
MLFNRREKPSLLAKIRGFLLPRAGWRRSAIYIGHRVARLPGTPASIAMGFACGAAASFTPLVGFHFLLAALLAWIFRGNLIASAIGTVVGNPWTFPFIWVATFEVGARLMGYDASSDAVNFSHFFNALWHSVTHLKVRLFTEQVLPVWLPMMVGSIPLGLLVWAVFYWPIKRTVASYQHARVARRHRKAVKADGERRHLVERRAEAAAWAESPPSATKGSASPPFPPVAMMLAGPEGKGGVSSSSVISPSSRQRS